jgi:hypothetical protein
MKSRYIVAAAALIAALFSLPWIAQGQQPVQTQPYNSGSSLVTAGTIASTGVWQVLLSSSTSRKGCAVQNQSTGSNVMKIANNAAGTGALIIGAGTAGAGGLFACQGGVLAVGDPLWITGTSGDAFVVWSQ